MHKPSIVTTFLVILFVSTTCVAQQEVDFSRPLEKRLAQHVLETQDVQPKQSSIDEFEQFGQLLIGRWKVDIIFISDWPGETQGKGEKATGYSDFKWIVDRKAIDWGSVGGNNSAQARFFFDAPSKRIRGFGVNSSGNTWEVVLWKESLAVWRWKVVGGGQGDAKMSGDGKFEFKDDGKMFVNSSKNMKLGDKKLDELKDEYRRLN